MKKYYQHFLLSFLTLICFSNSIIAQTQSKSEIDLPKLNGHKFITNSLIPNPFINSRISSNLGFASSLETEIPLLRFDSLISNNGNETIQLSADVGLATGAFEFSYAVQDWASIWVNFSGIGRFGTNTPTIFASGITANTTFETGMLFKIKEYKTSMISSSIKIENSNSTVLNIYEYIKNIIDSTNLNKNYLTQNYNPLSGSVDLRFAYAPSPKWSILAFIDGGYGELINIDSIENKFSYTVGGSFNYDLGLTTSLPFGIGAAFKINSNTPTLQYNKTATQTYMLQLIYTGGSDFLIGLESNYVRIPTRLNNVTINLSSFNLNWSYFFK
ncbi:MAG: hypothetical protein KDD00_10060 [Ignavibacteriae bacterium]|nr:hypothetical protein [Ignavibacteriota bacterium]